MGMHLSVYIGPYLQVGPVEKLDTTQVRSCSANCGNKDVRAPMRFCSQCGAAILASSSGKVLRANLSPRDLDGDLSDLMWCPEFGGKKNGCSVWLPNLGGYGSTVDESDEEPFELSASVLAAQLDAFRDRFGALVAAAQDLGASATIHFGVVPYWS